jgi:bifunctional DNase/RNase
MPQEMELVGIELERPPNIPCLLLREAAGEGRILPIFIGGPEATAIAFALESVETPRPMTHDLMKDLLDELGARVERVTITELRDATFFAEIALSLAGEVHTVSARPSDAVALAVRVGCRVYADEAVLEVAARPPVTEADEAEAGSEEVVEQFRAFIDRVNPEDFAS